MPSSDEGLKAFRSTRLQAASLSEVYSILPSRSVGVGEVESRPINKSERVSKVQYGLRNLFVAPFHWAAINISKSVSSQDLSLTNKYVSPSSGRIKYRL